MLAAIPHSGIYQNDAFKAVLQAFSLEPKPGTFHEWVKRGSESGLGRVHLPEELAAEAEIVLRDAIDRGDLTPLVLDPADRKVLRLPSRGWPFEIDGMSDEFQEPVQGRVTAANATAINNELQPVFFMKDEFDKWLRSVFGRSESAARRTKKRSSPQRDQAKKAILEVCPLPLPRSLDKKLYAEIELKFGADKYPPSRKTISRALADLHDDEN